MDNWGFHQLHLALEGDSFQHLQEGVALEAVGKGRLGNHLAQASAAGVPIVRTTTQYSQPAHYFSPAHQALVQQIQALAQSQLGIEHLLLNHALMEIYNKEYAKMGYHSDQALDLAPNSYIALFSCYEHPSNLIPATTRQLKVRDKTSQEERVFSLQHNTVLLFSTQTNSQYSHKIILPQPSKKYPFPEQDNRWLGLTFRQSKTFVQYQPLPHLTNGEQLTLANEEQQRAFYKLRGQENKSLDFVYPALNYTLSEADLWEPLGAK